MNIILFDYNLNTSSLDSISNEIKQSVNNNNKCWLACLNPHSYTVSKSDLDFSNALKSANWLIPDGIGIVIGARILKLGKIKRVTGPEIFSSVNSIFNESKGVKYFFLGSNDDVLTKIQLRLKNEFPNIEIIGTYSPPYKDEYTQEEIDRMVFEINKVKPDVLWVGLTAPKQEKWIFNNIALLDTKFVGAIGAVFDYYAGIVKQPPYLINCLGLDWLYRLLQQPKRLWKRTIISAPIYMFDIFKILLYKKNV